MMLSSRRMLRCAASQVAPRGAIRGKATRPSPSLPSSSPSSAAPLGVKDASQSPAMATNMKMVFGYIVFGLAAMATIARAKQDPEDVEESARVYNMAKRAVSKDRRFFEAVGYPKDFERILPSSDETSQVGASSSSPPPTAVYEGSFRVKGDKAIAIVSYKHRAPQAAATEEEAEDGVDVTDVPMFDLLQVHLEDGSEFSALEAYVHNEGVARQQKASSLGNKLVMPVLCGVVLGGFASFLVIRIVRNRPFYVHKLVLDHVNNSDTARKFLGHPITSQRSAYVGSLNDQVANYSVACKGPKGEGTLIVKAYKKTPEEEEGSGSGAGGKASVLATMIETPGTDWKFATLVLSIKRNELRKEKEKTAKILDLLASENKKTTVG